MKYEDLVIIKYLKSIGKKVKFNPQLQKLYNSDDLVETSCNLEAYNLEQAVPYLASGLSCYFNDQVNQNGLSNLKLKEEDIEDAKFIASCFGKNKNYSNNDLSVLYTAVLGTVEMNYGMQTFPAGIYEDVFQCSENHYFPIQPLVGEKEVDFFCRVLDYNISQSDIFPLEQKEEVLSRGKRLAEKFCNGKNRIYLIPFDTVGNNKASFGDVPGLRDGSLSGDELQSKLNDLYTFDELLSSAGYALNDYNFRCEDGVAIYGSIPNKGISFFEIERKYDLMQKKARDFGLVNGDEIPANLEHNYSL